MPVKFIVGAYYTYEPENNWARDGLAVVRSVKGDKIEIYDTYFSGASPEGVLSDTEMKSIKFFFNPQGWDIKYRESDIVNYDPKDVQEIETGHGLKRAYYLRKGAKVSPTKIIADAERRVEEAKAAARSSEKSVEYAVNELEVLKRQYGK